MSVLLLQLDGSLPNLALMRIAGHHRANGDTVHLRQVSRRDTPQRDLFEPDYDRVYGSLIFERSRAIAERLRDTYPGIVLGGTGWDLTTTVEGEGVAAEPDYSIYPNFPHSLGFTQRGCRLNCGFCVVRKKEGEVAAAGTAESIWRGEPHPRNLVLLDNDFFGQEAWRERIREFQDGKYKVNFNQGVNARFLTDEAAEAMASIDYFDGDFRKRRLYTAWDNRKDEDRLFAGLNRLVKYGVPPGRIMVYVLIGYWPGETEEDWVYRCQRLRDFGCDPYPMPYVRNSLTVGFQRWVCGHYDRKIPWPQWKQARCDPRRLVSRGRMPLPLFTED